MVFTLIAALIFPLAAESGPAPINSVRFLPTGTALRGAVENAIFSYNLEVPAVAQLESDAEYCNPLEPEVCYGVVFPRKTRLIGKALILKSNNRVNISFYLAVLPNGDELPISAIALSPDGSAGIKGKVKKHKDSMVASAALKGALSGAATVASLTANPVVGAAGEAMAQESVKEIDLSREQVDTSIETPAFSRCLIYLSQRVELKSLKEEMRSKNNAASKEDRND